MKGTHPYSGPALGLDAKLTRELQSGYYLWFGSLTTPPRTEGISWNLLKAKETVCRRQVEAIQNALSAMQNGISFNNRVTMPLNHRTVAETNTSLSATVDAAATETSDMRCLLMCLGTVSMQILPVYMGIAITRFLPMPGRGHHASPADMLGHSHHGSLVTCLDTFMMLQSSACTGVNSTSN